MRERLLRAADTAEADTREDAAVLAEVIRSAGAEASADVLEDILSAEEALPAATVSEQADTAVHAREACTITIMTTDGRIRQARIITIMSTEAAYLADIITTIHTADGPYTGITTNTGTGGRAVITITAPDITGMTAGSGRQDLPSV